MDDLPDQSPPEGEPRPEGEPTSETSPLPSTSETEQTMAYPTAVNGQITDAVTQANVTVLGDAPAQAVGALMLSLAQSQALAAANAVAAQQQNYILAQTVTTSCVQSLLGAKP